MAIVNFTYPKFKYVISSTGQPGVGYKLFTYEEGTSTKKTTWTSLDKTAENTNPIILDANGEADVWIDGNYKFVLALPTDTDPPTSPVWTYDSIRSTESGGVSTSGTITAVSNGSFETDLDSDGKPDDWTITEYTNGVVAIDTTTSTDGASSLKFTSTGSGGGIAFTTEYHAVEAGNPLGVYFSLISADVDTLNKVEVNWYNSSFAFLSTSTVYSNGATNPTSWTRYYTYAVAPSTAKYARISLVGVDPTSVTHTSTNFDNIEIDNHAVETLVSATVTPAGDADVTLTSTQYSSDRLVLVDGAWLSGHNIIVPNIERMYFVDNTSGTYTATIKTSAGTGVSVLPGTSTEVVCDGTNVLDPLSAYTQSAYTPSVIQPISASVGGSALTVTLNQTALDFRSPTLGSGSVNRREVTSPTSMVVSNGSTLGTVNGVKSRIAVLAIDVAGTVEIAVTNVDGGNNLDETTLISTTAEGGAGGADSASLIYSTTARANVPFRVVGFVESTQAAAGAWISNPSTVQGLGGNAFTAWGSMGYGQTRQNVTGSRVLGTTYYNDTGRPIEVQVSLQNSVTGLVFGGNITLSGVVMPSEIQLAGATLNSQRVMIRAFVMPGESYVVAAIAGTVSIHSWVETR